MEKSIQSRRTDRTTVVIPNYNGIEYMENCLASLLEGSAIPEVIVVDNGSADGSCGLIRERFPAVRLIELGENTGFCHAVNVGIRKADTEFVFLLNNDTTVEKSCVEELEKALEASPKLFCAGAKMINMKFPEKIDDAGDFYCALGWAFARGRDEPASKYQRDERIFSACAGAALYRREYLLEIGLFDEAHFAYLEDVDAGYRANIHGFRNLLASKALVYHAGSATSGSRHNRFKVELSSRNSVYLVYKNMPVAQLLINLPFLLAGFFLKFLFFAGKGLGKVYLKGLLRGIRLALSGEGRKRKVRFRWKRLPNYLWIQWELWAGIFRRFL